MTEPIAISRVVLGAEEERLVLEVLRSGQLAQGPMVARFESEFASLCDVRHAVAVSNGTVALVAALQAAGLAPGDEVVTAPFTFAATLNAILEVGATARFADIDPATFTIDPERIEAVVTDRTRALMPVHLYGQPAAMHDIMGLASARNLLVVEDAAQAHGAAVDGRAVGSFGVGCFSFYATKNIATGEGGIVTTNDDALAARLRVLRDQGMEARYEYVMAGHNYRLTDLQAAIALPQLARLDASTSQRRAHAARLSEGLGGVDGLVTPSVAPGRSHVFHQYTVRVTEDARVSRDDLAAGLLAAGVRTGVYYPRPVFDYDCYRDHPGVVVTDVPEAERAAREVLSLPVHPHLTSADLDRIIEQTRKLLGA
jgi:dTDP-4-amino-4,6-dideoxygalactose transaminase